MGSARVSRVGFGVTPKQSFDLRRPDWKRCSKKVRDREDAFASTRDAWATLPARAPARRPRALEQAVVRNRSFLRLPRDQLRGIRRRY
jgi:hypothetical protein